MQPRICSDFAGIEERNMPDPIVYGFTRSTFVNIVRMVLTYKEVPYTFHDLEPEMGKPSHLAHPSFQSRADPAAQRFHALRNERYCCLCRRSLPATASAAGRRPRPGAHGSMDQHGQLVLLPLHDLSRLPRAERVSRARDCSDEKVVAYALPKIEAALQVAERQLAHDREYLLGPELTLADFYLLPCTYSFSFAPEAKTMYPKFSAFCRWRERMEGLPAVKKLRASLPPRIPIEHAREWAVSHRPKY